ncbi:MAG: hypothetical protein ABIW76_14405 [Fibrobacteria bacterium]
MPIPTSIIDLIAAGVDAMSVVSGFNMDYGPVDIVDPAARTYPQDFLEFQEEGPLGTQMAGKQTSAFALTFLTLVPAATGLSKDEQAERAKEDHKRLMEALTPSLQAVGLLYHEPVSASWTPRLVRAVPIELKTTYRLVYRQDRANPAST